MKETRKGMLLVISGPSGAGKGTLVAKLLEKDPSFCFSVSVTTRGRREMKSKMFITTLFLTRNMINCLPRTRSLNTRASTVTGTAR